MGLFDFFKKKTTIEREESIAVEEEILSHEEKCKYAFNCCKKNIHREIFFNGLEQVSSIICSLSWICDIDLENSDSSKYLDILYVYTKTIIGLMTIKDSDREIISFLQKRHGRFISDEIVAKKVVDFCKKNMPDLRIDISEMITKGTDEELADSESPEEFHFENPMEFAIYSRFYNKGKDITWISSEKYLELYNQAYQLFERGNYEQAINICMECLKINPIGISARFEISECYIAKKQFSVAKSALYVLKDYLYDDADKAKFYRRAGYIAIEENLYEVAEACYRYSLKYDNHPSVSKELLYIKSKSKREISNNLEIILKENNIPIDSDFIAINSLDAEVGDKKTFTLTVPATLFEFYLESAYLFNNYTVPGFRVGKAPKNIIEKFYGENIFWDDAVKNAIINEGSKNLQNMGFDSKTIPNFKVINADKITGISAILEYSIQQKEAKDLSTENTKDLTETSALTVNEFYDILTKYYNVIMKKIKDFPIEYNDVGSEIVSIMFIAFNLSLHIASDNKAVEKNINDYIEKYISWIEFLPNSSEIIKVLDERQKLYVRIISGDISPRCEWLMWQKPKDTDEMTKCIIAFGDILFNPRCAEDYENAPAMIKDIFDIPAFSELMSEIGILIINYVKEISVSMQEK